MDYHHLTMSKFYVFACNGGLISLAIFFATLTHTQSLDITHNAVSSANVRIRETRDLNQIGGRKDSPTLKDREGCQNNINPHATINSTSRLEALRQLMATYSIDAYIIPSDDEHGSEYIADRDKRRQFISGFTGSKGTAVVTLASNLAALWTDGRYFRQGENELDCNWILMKLGVPGVPSIAEWLGSLNSNVRKVGVAPDVVTNDKWTRWHHQLKSEQIQLVSVEQNLVDAMWGSSRPHLPNIQPFVLPLKYAGVKWETKVKDLRDALRKEGCDAFVVTALDEVSWLLNMRGDDIPYNPVFKAYVIVTLNDILLFTNLTRLEGNPDILHHLQFGQHCHQPKFCVGFHQYETVYSVLKTLLTENEKMRVMLSTKSNYALYKTIPETRRKIATSPLLLPKATKNQVEVNGMKRSHLRDSSAIVEFLSELENDMLNAVDKNWTEISAADRLAQIRSKKENFFGLSFPTISAYGSNAAIIHYRPEKSTNKVIGTDSTYLLDSGAQYYDGTTDCTRTLHFGTPSDEHMEAYTRVLMGAVNLAMLNFPATAYGHDFDAIARQPLWDAGWDYRHGTGHGLGMFLNVHEGPQRIAQASTKYLNADARSFSPFMFTSDEPGYYEDGKFGIRLETVVMSKEVSTPNKFGNISWLGFEPIAFVPFEKKLIKFELLNIKQIKWLNNYHRQCRKRLAKFFKSKPSVIAWLDEKCAEIGLGPKSERVQAYGSASMRDGKMFGVLIVLILPLLLHFV